MRQEGVRVGLVRIAGEADLRDVDWLEISIEELLAAGHPVVVDLGDAVFVDAAVVQTVVAASERAAIERLRLVVLLPFSAAPIVRRLLLELAAITDALTIAPTMAAALDRAARPPAPVHTETLRDLRRSLWQTGQRMEELRRDRDDLRAQLRERLRTARETIVDLRRVSA